MAKPFPKSINQAFGLTGLIVLSMMVFALAYMEFLKVFSPSWAMFLYYILALGAPAILLHFKKKKEEEEVSYGISSANPRLLILVLFVSLGLLFGLSSPLSSLLPMSDWIRQAFMELSNLKGFAAFAMVAIAAPLLEEFIFRGIILEAFLKRYSPFKSILISSVLFGLVHLNPWQFISALIIGSFAGWLYYRTRNLWYAIAVHFFNNATAFLLMQVQDPDLFLDENLASSYGGETQMWLVICFSLIAIASGLYLLNRFLPQAPSFINQPSKEAINESLK